MKAWGYMAQPLLTRWQIMGAGAPGFFTKAGRLFTRRLFDQRAWDALLGRVSRLSPRPQHSVLPLARTYFYYFPPACLYAIFRHCMVQRLRGVVVASVGHYE